MDTTTNTEVTETEGPGFTDKIAGAVGTGVAAVNHFTVVPVKQKLNRIANIRAGKAQLRNTLAAQGAYIRHQEMQREAAEKEAKDRAKKLEEARRLLAEAGIEVPVV